MDSGKINNRTFLSDQYYMKSGLLGSGLKGASPFGAKLKGNFGKPLGRRAGSSGLSQVGKYIAQGSGYNSASDQHKFSPNNNSFIPYDHNSFSKY
jgi:hypothetical protein